MNIDWGTTLYGMVTQMFELSPELEDTNPNVDSSGTRVHISWAGTGVEGDAQNSVIDVVFQPRPVKPATITAKDSNPQIGPNAGL
jgi:hypothetical protein